MSTEKANLPFDTNLPHLLTPDGQVPSDLNSRERNFINFLGEIVTSVSGSRELMCEEPIRCRKYHGKKRCIGDIAAYCENKNYDAPIEWICIDCQQSGFIYEWQGSIFDRSELRQERIYDHIAERVMLNSTRLDEIAMPLMQIPGFTNNTSLKYPACQVQVVHSATGAIKLLIPSPLVVALFDREIISPRREPVAITLGHESPRNYTLSQIRYSLDRHMSVELEFLPESV